MIYQQGSFWSRMSYGTVVAVKNVNGVELITVENDDGLHWDITLDIVSKEFSFADQYTEEKQATKTELAEIFKTNARIIMTVNFNKKLDDKEFAVQLKDLYPNKGGKLKSKVVYDGAIDELVKNGLVGEERTMIGRHYGNGDDFGRVKFIDMTLDKDTGKNYDTRIRLVDPRTINWLIVNDAKYVRKT